MNSTQIINLILQCEKKKQAADEGKHQASLSKNENFQKPGTYWVSVKTCHKIKIDFKV